MGFKEKLPGMRAGSGHRKRNIVVGIAYAFVALSVLGTLAGAQGFDVAGTDIVAPDTDAADAEENTSTSGGDSDTSTEDAPADADEEEAIEASEPEAGAAAVEDASESALTPAEMESRLNDEGYDVEVADENGEIVVDYHATSPDEEVVASDIGAIAGAYAEMVDSGYETDRMVVVVQPPVGDAVGQTSVAADDAQAYADGEISDDEYAKILIDSAEAYD